MLWIKDACGPKVYVYCLNKRDLPNYHPRSINIIPHLNWQSTSEMLSPPPPLWEKYLKYVCLSGIDIA